MRVTLDSPASAPQPANSYYSQVARVELPGGGAPMYLSGRVADGPDLATQSRGVFETIAALPDAHGAGLDDIINIRTYLTDIGRLGEYAEWAAGHGLALFATVNSHGSGRRVAYTAAPVM